MPRLQATVPEGAPSQALLRVRLPDGQEVKVRVPEGLSPGCDFQFEVSSLGEIKTSVMPKKSTTESGHGGGRNSLKSKNPKKKKHHGDGSKGSNRGVNRSPMFISFCLDFVQKLYQVFYEDDPLNTSSSSHTSNHSKTHQSKNQTNSTERTMETTQKKINVSNYLGFLDRDIINERDFGTALAVGMFIGSSIVLGFLAGVLWVTPVE